MTALHNLWVQGNIKNTDVLSTTSRDGLTLGARTKTEITTFGIGRVLNCLVTSNRKDYTWLIVHVLRFFNFKIKSPLFCKEVDF